MTSVGTRHISAANGVTDIAAVTESDVSGFVAALRSGSPDHPALLASSAARAVVAVAGLHRFALREGLSGTDPAAAVRPPTPPRRLPRALPLDDVLALVEAAGFDGTPKALRDQALLEFLYGTGARIGEAVGLDVDDLDLERGVGAAARQGRQGPGRSGRGLRPGGVEAYLVRGRPTFAGAAPAGASAGAVRELPRRPAVPAECAGRSCGRSAERAGLRVAIGPHTPAALVCHPPARWGSGRPGGPGAARTCLGDDHPGLHAGDGGPAPRGLRHVASAAPDRAD